MGKMERRKRRSTLNLETFKGLLPPGGIWRFGIVLWSISHCIEYGEAMMTFPEDTGVYSLFPDEDLKTGRKKFRFEEERRGEYREGREYSHLVRSYPMLPHDRLHRPVDYSGSRQEFDNYRDRDRDRDRERHGRVYFDDGFRSNRFEFHRLTPRPRPIDRPVSPVIFETSRRPPPFRQHHHFRTDAFSPPPVLGQSKLPPGADTRLSGEDEVPTRIHVFDPESNSFGNPRNAGGGSSSGSPTTTPERSKRPPSNFVETGPPGPESFLNHEEFLEYQKKIAFSRFQEEANSNGGGGGSGGSSDGNINNNSGRKVLFESKEPFEIDGLSPPDKSAEGSSSSSSSGRLPGPSPSSGHSGGGTVTSFKPVHVPRDHSQKYLSDQRQLQREGQRARGNGQNNDDGTHPHQHQQQNHHHQQQHPQHNQQYSSPDTTEERDTGGGEVESEVGNQSEKGEVVESENGKSEVTQLPPTHHSKSGRVHSSSAKKQFSPSISHDEEGVGRGTGFRLPTASYSGADDDKSEPNLHGFVPVVPFHLRAEPPRAISLERQRQQQQQRIVPVHGPPRISSSTTTSTSTRRPPTTSTVTTTVRSIPVTNFNVVRINNNKEQYSGFRPATESKSSSTSSIGTDENVSSNSGGVGDSSLSVNPSPILHATAGERINSETHSKVAITKQQELKRLQKQKQLVIIPNVQQVNHLPRNTALTSSSSTGLFPEIIGGGGYVGDLVSSSEPVNRGTGTNSLKIYNNHLSKPTDPVHIVRDNTSSSWGKEEERTRTSTTSSSSSSSSTRTSTTNTNTTTSPHDTVDNTDMSRSIGTVTATGTVTASSNNNETIDRNRSLHEHESSTRLDETENNEIFDTRTVHTDNGIRQGEFHLEGYVLNGNSRSGIGAGALSSGVVHVDYDRTSKSLGSHPHLHGPPHPYDYPEIEAEHRAGEDDVQIEGDNALPLSHELPGTIHLEPDLTPLLEKTTPPQNELDAKFHDNNHHQAGHYASRSTEPSGTDEDAVKLKMLDQSLNPISNFESEPDDEATPPSQMEQRRTRFTQTNEGYQNEATPTRPYDIIVDHDHGEDEDDNKNVNLNDEDRGEDVDDDHNLAYYPYYKHYGNRLNVSLDEDGSRSSRRNRKSETNSLDDNNDGDGADENENDDTLNRLSGSYRHLPQRPETETGQYDTTSIDIPVELTLRLKENDGEGDEPPADVVNSIGSGGGRDGDTEDGDDDIEDDDDFDRNTNNDNNVENEPLFLESSETLINKTYYLDGNNSIGMTHDDKSLNNFIKVTRIKSPSGPSSKETSEKTSSTMVARRTAKPAVIVSTTAAGVRPRIVGSVVEAGPAWPGLVSNFIRGNNNGIGNRSFTATATVRPRGNVGTNPTHPTEIIARQIQHAPEPTQFKLQQLNPRPRPTVTVDRHHQQHRPESTSKIRNVNPSLNSSISGGGGVTPQISNAKLIKQVLAQVNRNSNHNNNNHNPTDNYSLLANTSSSSSSSASVNNSRSLFSSSSSSSTSASEENLSSSSQYNNNHNNVRSNSSTGVVSMVHAHISHCPKLHSPTEVICDVHIREGHGIHNPQLTVGWRRKFYNSTKPDVLLALNRAPASGENGHFEPHHSIMEINPGEGERLEEFHDKFNVTLAPGISPMLRSVLLIRSVTAPDCGTYQCEVNDGINVLQSETLLFLCH